MSAGAYAYDPNDDPDKLRPPQFDAPALAGPALTTPDQPYNEPALALAPDQRGGPAPTDALALHQPDPSDSPPGVDAISGGSLDPEPGARPPPPGGQLNTDQLMTAAGAPPPAGGGDAVDQTIAAAQTANEPPPPPAKPPTIQEQEKAGLAEQDKLASDAEKAERAAGAARAKMAEAAQLEAQQQAKLAAENAARQQAIIDQANARTQQWMDRSAAETDKYMRMGLHDYFDSKGAVGGTVSKILAGIAYITGAAGGRSLAENPGYQMVQGAIERDFRTQQAGIAKQKENVDLAKGQVAESLNQKQQALADNNLKKAAAYDAVAAQAVALKLKQGVPLEQAQTDAAVVGLRQKANATRMETLKAVHGQNVQDAQLADADERLAMEHERTGFEGQRVGFEKEELGIKKYDAETRRLAAEARARKLAKGKGGGGGGAGAAKGFDEMQKAAESDGATLASVIQAGMKAGMSEKIAAKEGKNLWNAYQKGAGADKKADVAVVNDVNDRMNKYETQAVGTARTAGPVRVLSQIEAMRQGLEEAAASGDSDRIKAAAVKAKEQAGTLMSGGKLTNAQIQILHTLESTSDDLTAKIGKFTGKPTEGKGLIKRLTLLIDDAGNETVQQIGDIRQRGIDEHLGSGGLAKTPEAKRTFLNRNKGLYGQVKWQGKQVFDEKGSEEPAGGGAGAGLSQQQAAKLLQFVKASPDDPRVPAAKAKLRDAGYQVP